MFRVLAVLAAAFFVLAGVQMTFYSTFPANGLEQPVRAFAWFSFGMAAMALRLGISTPR